MGRLRPSVVTPRQGRTRRSAAAPRRQPVLAGREARRELAGGGRQRRDVARLGRTGDASRRSNHRDCGDDGTLDMGADRDGERRHAELGLVDAAGVSALADRGQLLTEHVGHHDRVAGARWEAGAQPALRAPLGCTRRAPCRRSNGAPVPGGGCHRCSAVRARLRPARRTPRHRRRALRSGPSRRARCAARRAAARRGHPPPSERLRAGRTRRSAVRAGRCRPVCAAAVPDRPAPNRSGGRCSWRYRRGAPVRSVRARGCRPGRR